MALLQIASCGVYCYWRGECKWTQLSFVILSDLMAYVYKQYNWIATVRQRQRHIYTYIHTQRLNVMQYKGWIFFRGEYFSGVTIFQEWIFFRCEYFQEWLFFRGDYFSGVNIFQGRVIFKEEYFSRVIFLKGWTFFRYTI